MNVPYTLDKKDSSVYIISWESTPDVVKIGRTTNLGQRFNQFLTAHHDPLIVRCVVSEDICNEDYLHRQFDSARKTLEHFELTEDLQEKIHMLNVSTGFAEYKIPRKKHQTGLYDDLAAVEQFKDQMGIPPLRMSRLEKDVMAFAALGMTVFDTAEGLGISESAVKVARNGVQQKAFTPNLVSAVTKLLVHKIIDLKELTNT